MQPSVRHDHKVPRGSVTYRDSSASSRGLLAGPKRPCKFLALQEPPLPAQPTTSLTAELTNTALNCFEGTFCPGVTVGCLALVSRFHIFFYPYLSMNYYILKKQKVSSGLALFLTNDSLKSTKQCQMAWFLSGSPLAQGWE